MDRSRMLVVGGGGVLLVLLLALAWGCYALSTELKEVRNELEATHTESQQKEAELSTLLAQKTEESAGYLAAFRAEREKTGAFEGQISDISSTIGTLEKLAKTDPELLAKYSKVYFLNENYAPENLSPIPSEFVYEKGRTLSLESRVAERMQRLLREAKEDDVELLVVSAYRSFGEQASLKAQYRVSYGSGANAFSADQGYSEHQLGTTVDFTTESVGGTFTGFDNTEAYEWLTDNAWRYGFVLSYPKGNRYYQYEPWHWRFVGKDLAKRLHEDDQHFYDLDQRTIDQYLASLFD